MPNNFWSLPRFFLSPLFFIAIFGSLGLIFNLVFYSKWNEGHSIYVLGLMSFAVMYCMTSLAFILISPTSNKMGHISCVQSSNRLLLRFYWLISLIGVFAALHSIITTGLLQDGSLFYNLRFAHTIERTSNRWIGHLSLFSLALALYYAYQKQGKLSLVTLFLSLLGSLAFSERTSILFKISAVYYVWIWLNGLKIKITIFAIVALFSLFTIIAFSAGKLGGTGAEFFLVKYIGFGLTAIDMWVLGHEPIPCFSSVFGSIIGGSLDILFSTKQSCGSFQGAPDGMFNVYTYVSAPYFLYGEMGVLYMMFFLGGLYSVLYNIAQIKRGLFILMTGVLTYPLIMVFYAWQFSLTTYFYMLIILIPLFSKFGVSKK